MTLEQILTKLAEKSSFEYNKNHFVGNDYKFYQEDNQNPIFSSFIENEIEVDFGINNKKDYTLSDHTLESITDAIIKDFEL